MNLSAGISAQQLLHAGCLAVRGSTTTIWDPMDVTLSKRIWKRADRQKERKSVGEDECE